MHKHKLKPGCFPYECEEKELTRKRQEYAEDVLEDYDEHAARVVTKHKVNPKVKNVSLWTLHGKRPR
jgi:hypothetical protein